MWDVTSRLNLDLERAQGGTVCPTHWPFMVICSGPWDRAKYCAETAESEDWQRVPFLCFRPRIRDFFFFFGGGGGGVNREEKKIPCVFMVTCGTFVGSP